MFVSETAMRVINNRTRFRSRTNGRKFRFWNVTEVIIAAQQPQLEYKLHNFWASMYKSSRKNKSGKVSFAVVQFCHIAMLNDWTGLHPITRKYNGARQDAQPVQNPPRILYPPSPDSADGFIFLLVPSMRRLVLLPLQWGFPAYPG